VLFCLANSVEDFRVEIYRGWVLYIGIPVISSHVLMFKFMGYFFSLSFLHTSCIHTKGVFFSLLSCAPTNKQNLQGIDLCVGDT